MRRLTVYLLAGYLILQLIVPGYFVFRHYDTLNAGENCKFEVVPYDPYDPFRGRYVSLQTTFSLSDAPGEYAMLEKDASGYTVISGWQAQRPQTGLYAKNLQLNRYYMNERMAPEAERIQRDLDLEKESMYLLVKVKNGDYVIQGLYINDIPIEQYITKQDK